MESKSNVFPFKDEKTKPDPFFDYSSHLLANKVPLVIDNGSYKCRAGWADQDSPSLVFKNVTAKQRGKKNQSDVIETQIGNDISQVDAGKCILRSQFDRNLVTLYDVEEQIFDYIFSHLGINTEGKVDHPIVLTEAVCNPNYCRQLMSELMFECYNVPQVAYGVDSLFSFYHNQPSAETGDAFIIDCGYQATHLLPVLNGRIDANHCRRINMGGAYVDWFLQRLLQLKYPGHLNAITLARAEEIVRDHCYAAVDFLPELSLWGDGDYFETNVRKMQLPMAQVQGTQTTEQQKERRKQQISRLQEVNTKRRMDKLNADESELQKLLEVQELLLNGEDDACMSALSEVGIHNVEELQTSVDRLSTNIQRAKAKLLGQEPAPIELESKEPSFPLLGIPDEMLTPDQLVMKKRQRILKSARDGRNKVLALQREKRQKEREEEKKLEERRRFDFKGWLNEVRSRRQKIVDARNTRRQKKSDMAKRRTFASQQRMRIISQLAAQPSKKGDTFGQDDADWDVYKEINRDGGTSDSEAEEEKLEELENMLKEHDPEFQKELDLGGLSGQFDIAEYHRLHIGVERIRVPEILFQPSMLGLDQGGIAESLDYILGKMDASVQDRVVKNVFLTGGNANFTHLASRLEHELQMSRPFQSHYGITTAANPSLDAWHGARKFALSSHLTVGSITRKDYEEMGEGYLREHCTSNKYFPSPGMLFKND